MPTVKTAPTGISYILDGKYPDFIKNHGIFKKMSKINKVFPSFGLPNISEEVAWTGEGAVVIAKELLYYDIRDGLAFVMNDGRGSADLQTITKLVFNALTSYYSSMIKEEEGRIVLRLDRDIVHVDHSFKTNEGIFKVYTKLKELWAAAGVVLKSLEEMPRFKTFSSANLPNKKYQIVFSSTGEKGAWDIATISMRGISSCQSWTSSNARGLVGSISSQFVGVIYLTDGADYSGMGSRMIRRSLVRFGIHHQTKKPALFIDRVYPTAAADTTAMDIFKKFLAAKTGLPIIVPNDPLWGQYYMPVSYIYNKHPLGQGEYTYMDQQIRTKKEFVSVLPISSWNNSITTRIQRKLSETIKARLDSYLADKKTNKSLFKGGTANLIAYLHRKLGTMEGAFFIPKTSLLNEVGLTAPVITDFTNQKDYHRAYLKKMLCHMGRVKEYQQSWMRRGHWYKDFPKSSEKLFESLWKEYKQLLIEEYVALGAS